MMEPHAHPALMTGEMPELIEHPDAATDVRRHGGAGHPHLGKRPPAENETRPERDIEGVCQPERAHGEHSVTGAAENRIDQKNQKHRRVTTEHHPGEVGAHDNDGLFRPHQPENLRREISQDHPQAGGS